MTQQIGTRAAYGMLTKKYCNEELPLTVLNSQAGFFIGTVSEETGYSRESVEYFRTKQEALDAFNAGEWTQKLHL